MTATIQDCQSCGQNFWGAPPWNGVSLCPACAGSSSEDEPGIEYDGPLDALTRRRFVTLSALPGGSALPPRRSVTAPRPVKLPRDLPSPTAPAEIPGAEARQIGFNCPACFTVLIIKDPAAYNGKPAPCPCCANNILPPRIIHPSPFSLVSEAPVELPAPPAPAALPAPREKHYRPERTASALRDMLFSGDEP